MEIEGGEWIGVFLMFMCVLGLSICITGLIYDSKIILSQETANQICLDITEKEGVVALDYNGGSNSELVEKGELYCQLPSYDETHLIKVGK